jgi:TonB-linked SusC/RagA family outer membrane protein
MKRIVLLVVMALATFIAYAQTTVTGTVTSSDDGQPIPFANVMIKGTTTGAFTDSKGMYSIKCTSNATLIFSALGFSNVEIPVGGKSVVNAILKTDATMLDETIVVAYGTAKKGTFTGAASVVKQDAIKDVPTASFESALNGKIAGLQITQSSGQAGSTSSIRIRGIGSMNASNEPLYVIDGVPVSSGDAGQMSDYIYSTNNVMSTLNPSDIESITVLKDAAASSLYGSRAANGVIMVTTKKGKSGKPLFTFKTSVGITPSWATKNYETASTQDQVQMLYEVLFDSRISRSKPETEAQANAYALKSLNNKFNKHGYSLTTDGTGRYANIKITGLTDGVENRDGKYYNWEDALFRTAVYQTYDLSVSGGTDATTYYSSLAYTSDKGRAIDNDYSRVSGRVNLNQKVGKYVELATSVNIANTKKSGYNDTRSTGANYFMQTRNLLWGLYWPTNYKTGDPWTARYGSYAQNTLYYRNEWENSSKTFKVQASEGLTIHILPELALKSIFSYDYTNVKDHLYYSAEHFNGSSDNGSVTEMATSSTKLVSSTTLNYNKTLAEKHNIGVLVGFEAEDNKTTFTRASGTNLPTSSLHTVSTAGKLDAAGYDWGNSMVSVLSRAEYNYDAKYYASASYRRDGSSKLSKDSRWGNFWSVAASWKISNEKFMKEINWISNLRLRASYGVNGTLPSNNYGWRSLTGYSYKYIENPGGALSTVADKNLSWETSYSTNAALEFGLFDQRLYGTVEFFNRDSKDLLQDVPISTITGFGSTLKNVGEINNKGFEIEVGGDIIRNKEITWSASISATLMKSKVTKLYGGQDIIWDDPTGGDARAQFIYREGQSTLAFYGYEWAGVNPTNGRQYYYSNNENKDEVVNGRNVVYDFNDASEVIIGSGIPKIYGGINTNVEWKGISLGLNFIYKLGSKLYDGAEKDVDDDGYYWERIRTERVAKNRWTTTGQNTVIPLLRGTDLEDAMNSSTRHLHCGDFLRLKTITLGYNLPKRWISKIGLASTRVYFSGQNLFTWAAFDEVDPEVNSYSTRGWETPYGKTYTFGIELSF